MLSLAVLREALTPRRTNAPGATAPPYCDPAGRDGGPGAAVSFIALLRQRPALVLVAPQHALLPALLYRLFRRSARLLLWSDGASRSPLRRLALHVADGVLVGSDAAAASVAALRGSDDAVFNVPGPYDIAAFLTTPPTRGAPAARRILLRGALEPGGEGMHALQSAAAWAERHPSQRIELSWIGAGDLRGVLAAQSVPDNLSQRFLGRLTPAEIVAAFAEAGVLIATADATDAAPSLAVAEAMASGLVVLFDRDYPAASRLLQDQRSGIGYDAAAPDGLLAALSTVMAASDDALDMIRLSARRRVLPMDPAGFRERLDRAIACVRGSGPGSRTGSRVADPLLAEAMGAELP